MIMPKKFRGMIGGCDCPVPAGCPDGAAAAEEHCASLAIGPGGCQVDRGGCGGEPPDEYEEYEEVEDVEAEYLPPKRSLGTTMSGHRKYMKGLGRQANTTLSARRTAQAMGVVGRRR